MALDFSRRRKHSKFIEVSYPLIISLIFIIFSVSKWGSDLFSNYLSSTITVFDFRSFISTVITIESIIFGFLLTALALTIQTSTPSMTHIRQSGSYKKFIRYNKWAAYCSLLVVILSAILFLCPEKLPDYLYIKIWFGFIIFSFLLTYRYLRIFYIVINEVN